MNQPQITDKKTNSTQLKSYLYMPKSFQYTITNCFCGGNCQASIFWSVARDTRKGWPLLTVETEVNGDSMILNHSLNMELGLQSLFGLLARLYSLAETTQPPPLPPAPHLVSYTRAILVSQDRQHLFVTPGYK
jgi:hypothetical protein